MVSSLTHRSRLIVRVAWCIDVGHAVRDTLITFQIQDIQDPGLPFSL
jgi:hypothetical protein